MEKKSEQPKPTSNAIQPRTDRKIVIENLQETDRHGLKVVQVELDGKDYLIFEAEGEGQHRVIFSNFLRRHNVEPPNQNPDDPNRFGERYKLIGAGSLNVVIPSDGGRKRLDFRASAPSFRYEINLDYERLSGLESELKDWQIQLKYE